MGRGRRTHVEHYLESNKEIFDYTERADQSVKPKDQYARFSKTVNNLANRLAMEEMNEVIELSSVQTNVSPNISVAPGMKDIDVKQLEPYVKSKKNLYTVLVNEGN
jgi:hypothetical protein